MKKFVQLVPISYHGNHGMRPKSDCFALVSNVASEKYKSSIFAVSGLKLNIGSDNSRNNLREGISIRNFTSVIKTFFSLSRFRPDIVFGNDRTAAGFIAAFFGKHKLFMSHQSMNPPKAWQKAIFKYFVRKFDAIKVSNPYEIEQLVELGVDRKKIFYIPIPIDHEFFSRVPDVEEIRALKKKIGLKPNDKFLLSVSHIRSQKKAYTAIYALKELKKKYPKLKLVFTGKDILRDEGLPSVAEKANELGIKSSVIVTGRLPEDDLVGLMHSAKVGIISSAREGQCLTAYEKAAAGLPLCLSNIGSFTSVFNGSVLFHEPDDFHTLASNVSVYLENPELGKKFSNINKKLVVRLTDYKKVWKQMKNMLLNLD